MQIKLYSDEDIQQVVNMSLQLWKEYTKSDILALIKLIEQDLNQTLYVAKKDNLAIGFIMVSLRFEYVEGATSSPVGYVEGVFVNAEMRIQGIAKSLILKGEEWAKSKGCTQMASDTWYSEIGAQKFHQGVGFKEEDILVHYIKEIN